MSEALKSSSSVEDEQHKKDEQLEKKIYRGIMASVLLAPVAGGAIALGAGHLIDTTPKPREQGLINGEAPTPSYRTQEQIILDEAFTHGSEEAQTYVDQYPQGSSVGEVPASVSNPEAPVVTVDVAEQPKEVKTPEEVRQLAIDEFSANPTKWGSLQEVMGAYENMYDVSAESQADK